jgi:adenylate cyclase class 2
MLPPPSAKKRKPPQMPLEVEVKFFLDDADPVRKRLLGLGARAQERCFEHNLRLEDRNRSLLGGKSLLRLRRDRRTTLTYKSRPPSDDSRFKVHHELEVEIDDFRSMLHILEALGFHVEQKYEKWRQTLTLGSTQFCLDTMPFGNFLEIEGSAEAIRRYSGELGLDWRKRILLNYLQMFEIIRNEFGLPFKDLTFDNFKDHEVDISVMRQRFEAGA